MSRIEIGTTTLVQQEVTIQASKDGSWYLVDGEGVLLGRNDVLEKAEAQAKTKLAKAKIKVEVPFFTDQGEEGVATGFHAQNDDILARIGGNSERLGGYRRHIVLRPDTPPDVIEAIAAARQAKADAEETIRSTVERHAYDLRAALTDAIEAERQKAST